MSRKKLSIIALVLVFVAQILVVAYNLQTNNGVSESLPPENPGETPEGPEFVIPESPVGIVGMLSAFVAAFGIFALAKKRK